MVMYKTAQPLSACNNFYQPNWDIDLEEMELVESPPVDAEVHVVKRTV